jgi:hypothetical protein
VIAHGAIVISPARFSSQKPGHERATILVETLFAELNNEIGLRRLRLRRLKFGREQFFLVAAAQNIKQLVRFLSQGPKSIMTTTT